MAFTVDDIKACQPDPEQTRQRSPPLVDNGGVRCLACQTWYLTTEEYWQRDDCPDHGEAYGGGSNG